MPPLTRGRKQRAIRESPLQPVGNGLDRSVNLPTCWGRLPHSVREMSRSDRGRPPPSAGGTRKARDGGASYIKIYGRAWKPAPTNGAPSRRPLRSNCFLCVGNGLDHSVKHIKLRGQTQFAPTSREQPLCCSVKLHQNLRAGVETRPYKRVVETPTPTHEMECGCPTTPNLSSCAIAKDLTYKRNHICKSFFAERRRMTKAAGFSNFAAFIVCLHTKRKNPDAYASGISGSRYKTNHLPHLLTTSNAVDGERGIIPFRCVYIITADYCNPNTNL